MAEAEHGRLAAELVRQATQLQEMEQAIHRLDQLMNQADQRAKFAEEKPIAAVKAIGMVKISEQQKIKLNNRDAEKFWPVTYTATYGRALAPGLSARPLLERAAAFRDRAIVRSDVEANEVAHGKPFDLKEVSEALGPLLHKVCRGSSGVKLKAVLKTDGFNAWRVLAFWFRAIYTNDSTLRLTMIMNPDSAEDLSDTKLDRWDAVIRDNEMKFKKDDISDTMRQAVLLVMAPGNRGVGWEKRAGQPRESPLHDRRHDQGQERSEEGHPIFMEEAINRRWTSTG